MRKWKLSALMVLGMTVFGVAAAVGSELDAPPGAMYAKAGAEGPGMLLPLRSTDVNLWVSAGFIHAEVSQVFENTSEQVLEAVYIFPLPSRAAVTDMVMETGGRVIRSVVKERAEAKKVYDEAKREGKRTALIESERPNVFTTSLSNLAPGDTIKISVFYTEPMPFRDGRYEVNFPMVVGPRYIPFEIGGGDAAETAPPRPADLDAARISPPRLHPAVDSGHRIAISAVVEGLPLKEIVSHTHEIEVAPDGDRHLVWLRNADTRVNRDFNLKLILRESLQPEISTLSSVLDGMVYSMINVFPPMEGGEVDDTPREVVFLIDTSGSMSGESIVQARAGLRQCLSMLRPGDQFNIVRFSSDYSGMSPAMKPFAPDVLEAAKKYVDGLEADGGTEMQTALAHVLDTFDNQSSDMQIVVLLTDGDVGGEDSLLRLLRNRLGRRRLFTFAIGSAPNEHLMRKMATEGRGEFRIIHSHEDVGMVMGDFFRTLSSPVMTDVSLDWLDAEGAANPEILFFPNPCPDIFSERPLTLLVKYPLGTVAEVVVKGNIAGERRDFKAAVPTAGNASYPSIEKMFASAWIDSLMMEITTNPPSEEANARMILDIALRHQLVTRYTSRVAVEERRQVAADGEMVTVNVPVELPHGWNGEGFYPTASNHPLYMVLGLASLLAGLATLLAGLALRISRKARVDDDGRQ